MDKENQNLSTDNSITGKETEENIQENIKIQEELIENDDNIEEPTLEEEETAPLEENGNETSKLQDENNKEKDDDELAATPEEFKSEVETVENNETETSKDKEKEELQESSVKTDENNSTSEKTTQWEEVDSDNSVVKKYILYISKDFVPLIDNLNVDQRSAFVNDAIQKKLDLEDIEVQNKKKKKIFIHILISIITICIMMPISIFIVNKSIMATFKNYKYSQDNFEKLYKQKFAKDRAYIRSLEYNKALEKKIKKINEEK